MTSRTTPRRAVALIAFVAVALMAAACTQPTPTAPPVNKAGLRTALVDGGLAISWNPTTSGQINGYELQFRTDGGEWTPIATGPDAAVTFTAVTPRTWYSFRVRSKVPTGTTPNAFSDGASAWYVEPELPVVRIDTDNAAPILDKENYVRATMTLDPNGSGYAPYTGTLGIKGRGNSTWGFPKKPYRLKLDAKSPMMGIASSKDWVLLANWFDRSQIRTSAAEAISKSTGLAWTPTYRHVEVVLNGQYVGVYQFTEAVKPAATKVNIPELKETDVAEPAITGGYLLEIDARLEENDEPGIRTPRNVPVVIKEPDPATPQQSAYILGKVQQLEDSLFAPDFADPVTGYRRFLDVNSFIDHYLVQEITRNGDGFWSSTYFYKNRNDDRFYFGPMWDFDRSIGSPVTVKPQPPEGWYSRTTPPWVRRLFQDPAFIAQVDARFRQLLPALRALPDQLEATGESLEDAIDNDEARWGYTVGAADEPEYIEDWLEARLDWMEQNSSPLSAG